MASFFDPCINIVLEGICEPIVNLLLDVNVGLLRHPREDIDLIEKTESRACWWFCRVALRTCKN